MSLFTPRNPLLPRLNLPVLLLGLIAAAYCMWIGSLPLLPTQDGPIHLYFARVLQALVFHVQPGIYPRFYTVKHLLPPYALYYYLLILLEQWMPWLLADKVVICLYVVLFLFGFRFLANSVGPRGDLMALLASPLAINWPLAMGFVNFCLSAALAMFALGLWCGFATRSSLAYRAAFVALCLLVMLTHPVPLLLVLAFASADLAVRWARRLAIRQQLLADLATLLAGSATLLYLRAFTAARVFHQTAAAGGSYLTNLKENAPTLILLHTLLPFAGSTPLDRLYRCAILATLLAGLLLGRRDLRESLRLRRWTRGNTWYVLAIALAMLLPFLPPDLNGSHFFAARLVVVVWLAMLAAASGSPATQRPHPWGAIAACLFAVATTGSILLLGSQRVAPVAAQLAEIETMPLPPAIISTRRVVLMLNDARYTERHTLNYDPYRWSGARLLRRTDSVLYNTPWLDLPIIPLGAQPDGPTAFADSVSLEFPPHMRRDLLANPGLRARVFSQIDRVLINHGTVAFDAAPDAILDGGFVADDQWVCTVASIYSLCARR